MSDVPPSPDHHPTKHIEPGSQPDSSGLVPDPPVFPARVGAPVPSTRAPGRVDPSQEPLEPTTQSKSELWPDWAATSQIQPAELGSSALFAPDPPVEPADELAVIRIEGLTSRSTAPGETPQPGGLASTTAAAETGTSMAGTPLLSLDDIEQATEAPLEIVERNPLASMLSFGRDRAQTLYRRQTVLAAILLVILFAVGAVTFPRSWRDPGPGLAVDAVDADADAAGGPSSPADGAVGPAAEAEPTGAAAENRGSIAGIGSAPAKSTTRAATTEDVRADGNVAGVSTTTSVPRVETSATVGPVGTGQPCPGGLPIAGCTTTSPGPAGPTTVVVEVSTSTTRILVVSTEVPTTEATTTTRRTSTTRATTTTRRSTTAGPTTTRKPRTTVEPTTTTTTTRPQPTTPTTTATTGTTRTTTTSATTTTTTTTPGPTESQGPHPTVVVCEDLGDGTTPTTECLPDP